MLNAGLCLDTICQNCAWLGSFLVGEEGEIDVCCKKLLEELPAVVVAVFRY